jgi:hypothetical protein
VHVVVKDGGINYVADFSGGQPHADVPPTATPSTSALGFGYVATGTTATESFSVRNTGGTALAITGVTIDDPTKTTFSGQWDTCAGAVLPAGWSCTVRIAAHPTGRGTVTGSVLLTTANGQQAAVVLSAAGS